MKNLRFPCGCMYVENWVDEPGVHDVGLCRNHARALIDEDANVFFTIPCEGYDLDELVEKLCERLRTEREMREWEAAHLPPSGPVGLVEGGQDAATEEGN